MPWVVVSLFVLGLAGLMSHGREFEAIDAWGLVFVFATAAGVVIGLWKRGGVRWIVASVPFWVFANANGWMMMAALSLVIGGMAAVAVAPTLPGRRLRRSGQPLAALANGPLVRVEPRTFTPAHASRVMTIASIVFGILALVLPAVALAGVAPDVNVALGIAAAIIAATFSFGNWFATRLRLRIDATGLHSRALFIERTVRWQDVSAVGRRWLFLPGMFLNVEYYCVRSPTREFAFPTDMRGADELRQLIETATGMQF